MAWLDTLFDAVRLQTVQALLEGLVHIVTGSTSSDHRLPHFVLCVLLCALVVPPYVLRFVLYWYFEVCIYLSWACFSSFLNALVSNCFLSFVFLCVFFFFLFLFITSMYFVPCAKIYGQNTHDFLTIA